MNFSIDDYLDDSTRNDRPYLDSVFSDRAFPISDWQMSLVERFALRAILEKIKPKIAIEIGTHKGGSLQLISHYSERVISIDINDYGAKNLSSRFSNVEFNVEDSTTALPKIINELRQSNLAPDFILVDGSHSKTGVMADLNNILQIIPNNEMAVVCHDSFNPNCRSGMIAADWESSPYVQFADLDFIIGNIFNEDFDTAVKGDMWSGFALALFSQKKRRSAFKLSQSRQLIYESTLANSKYSNNASDASRSKPGGSGALTEYIKHCRPMRYLRKLSKP